MRLVRTTIPLVAALLAASLPAMAQAHREAAARDAVAADRNDANASLLLGRVLRKAARHDAALAELNRGSRLASARPLALRLGWEIARVQLDRENFQGAMAACRQLASIQGGAALSHACLAYAHMLHKRATEAAPEIAKALSASPGLYEAKVVEGYVKWQESSHQDAEQAFRAAAAADAQRSEAWLGLGRFLLATGHRPQAVEAFEKAVAADGDDPDALYALGSVESSNDRAARLLQQAVQGRPTFGAAHAKLGEAFVALGKMSEAEAEARAALQCTGVEPDWHALLGEILLAKGQPDLALQSAESGLKLINNHARSKLLQADAWSAKGDIDLAIEAWQLSFGLARTIPTPLVHGALGCLANNRPTTARAFADRALYSFPNWGPALEASGDVAAKANDKAAARAAYQKALNAEGPVNKDAIRRKLATSN